MNISVDFENKEVTINGKSLTMEEMLQVKAIYSSLCTAECICEAHPFGDLKISDVYDKACEVRARMNDICDCESIALAEVLV